MSRMLAWAILPIVLPVFSITGMWIVYAMALSNNHICSITNWAYNQSCELEGPSLCCTLDHLPMVSKCGNLPPESCLFSLICSLGSFLVVLVCLLRYADVIERCGPSLVNTVALVVGWISAAGLMMAGNFQVSHAMVLHYIGALLAFTTSMLFLSLQMLLTYRMARVRWQCWNGHFRCLLTLLGLVTLIISVISFTQDNMILQHMAALCEWIFIINVLIFYGTFAFEFGAISTKTFLVLLKASRAPKSYKLDSSSGTTPHAHSNSENLAMI